MIGWVLALATGCAAGAWAAHELLAGPEDTLEAPEYTLVEVGEGTVGQSMQLNTSAQWPTQSVVPNQASGVLTSLEFTDGERAEPGDVLYTVDLHPVVVAAGDVPAFRDLSAGTRGEDVAQFQELLLSLGYDVGKADGIFGSDTERAVRAWQRDLGVAEDGVVSREDVLYVPGLPERLALHPDLATGDTLTGGEEAVRILDDAPSFTITLPENQAQMVEPGMAVQITREDGDPWSAEIDEVRSGETPENSVAVLDSTGDAPICGNDCPEIPLDQETLLPSVIQVVPEVSGLTVPAAALVTRAEGDVGVVSESGEFLPVTVVESAGGTAVVEGVEAGMQVRAPGRSGDMEADGDGSS
ncbi:peptidoglycan-binding protein [Actinobacteria bacterium YIM 96077]|uniref:Peptidoglycan-binding protein n=1 Tax=Phytoactinopolyspora halophila TaxID=1981511 RepID=A0A329QPE8_9ACTN|nr:peptidoglycan-binding protein [Actinobacteria bacterium YIM 96077]RAW13751.1 peptidoglycan-binding protein [Phytoactinopolyspora halophila]